MDQLTVWLYEGKRRVCSFRHNEIILLEEPTKSLQKFNTVNLLTGLRGILRGCMHLICWVVITRPRLIISAIDTTARVSQFTLKRRRGLVEAMALQMFDRLTELRGLLIKSATVRKSDISKPTHHSLLLFVSNPLSTEK